MNSINPKINVIIPVYNEETSLPLVLKSLKHLKQRKSLDLRVIVGNNNSTDRTAEVAEAAGAEVVLQPEMGYGAACLKAMEQIDEDCDIVVYIDGDYSDYPHELDFLIEPIQIGVSDFVIGSRVLGAHLPGALLPQARFGNWIATFLIHFFWGHRFSDLGPFRAITYQALKKLKMQDRNFGWTVEMQIRALKCKLKCSEIPVSYRKRIGKSKITGTIQGSVMAGYTILKIIFAERFTPRRFKPR